MIHFSREAREQRRVKREEAATAGAAERQRESNKLDAECFNRVRGISTVD